jgi:CDP-diacylglycerol--glycerol-3-phosphate 3-phosphatidyltransferase
MNLPNVLTVLRIFLTGGLIYCLMVATPLAMDVAFGLFILAGATDYLDGHIARKYHKVTKFGKITDPIADKLLILSAFFVFMRMQIIAGWMFYTIAVREIVVTLSRFYAMHQGKILEAERLGKAKTVSQMAVIVFILACLMSASGDPLPPRGRGALPSLAGGMIAVALVFVVTLTLLSGITYFWHNRAVLGMRGRVSKT